MRYDIPRWVKKARGQNEATDRSTLGQVAEVSEKARGAYTQEQAQHSANEGKETGMQEELCPCDDARSAQTGQNGNRADRGGAAAPGNAKSRD